MVKFRTRAGLSIIALLVAVLFVGSLAFAQPAAKPAQPGATTAQPTAQPQAQGAGPSKDWTDQQLQDFVKKPWTQEELNKMGRPPRYILNKTIHPRATDANLTAKQLYENGENRHRALMLQYGLGINAKDFYKIWFEQEGFKDPKIKLLDLRQESEFQEARIPGSIRVDTGLAYWQLPGKAPDSTLTYYLLCKGGTPENGGSRGALVAKAMIDMGYSGKIINITDGFRGWIENGFPVYNQHGLFTLVPGSFQVPEKDAPAMEKQVTPVVAPMVMDEAKKLNIKDW
jgi:rhodanese-related sulfurtransferase